MSYLARFQAAFESATRLAHAEAATAGALPVRVGVKVQYGYGRRAERQTYTGAVVRMYNGRGMPNKCLTSNGHWLYTAECTVVETPEETTARLEAAAQAILDMYRLADPVECHGHAVGCIATRWAQYQARCAAAGVEPGPLG